MYRIVGDWEKTVVTQRRCNEYCAVFGQVSGMWGPPGDGFHTVRSSDQINGAERFKTCTSGKFNKIIKHWKININRGFIYITKGFKLWAEIINTKNGLAPDCEAVGYMGDNKTVGL